MQDANLGSPADMSMSPIARQTRRLNTCKAKRQPRARRQSWVPRFAARSASVRAFLTAGYVLPGDSYVVPFWVVYYNP